VVHRQHQLGAFIVRITEDLAEDDDDDRHGRDGVVPHDHVPGFLGLDGVFGLDVTLGRRATKWLRGGHVTSVPDRRLK